MYQDNQFIIPDGLYWPEILRKDVPKSGTTLQPIFEAFTNSIEAIRDQQKIDKKHKGEILIKIYATETTIPGNLNFSSITIQDNGIGFNDEQFERFNKFRDNRKNYKNLGSGRIQYAHYFNTTNIKSVFAKDGIFYEREFVISKNQEYINHNAIVKHKYCKKTAATKSITQINFNSLLEESSIYNELTDEILKKKLIDRYIHYFCYNQNNLPQIKIEYYKHTELISESSIIQADIPKVDKRKVFKIQYSKKGKNGVEKIEKKENFEIHSYRISQNVLKENSLKLVSKGEVIEEALISLENLTSSDTIRGSKFLFLVSSNFIDDRDTNLRGVVRIPTKQSFTNDLYANETEIFIDDIQEEVNGVISSMYPEIEEVKQKHRENYEKLKKMFLLDDEIASEIQFSINDTESKILEKFYEIEAKKTATLDASIKESVDKVMKLDTTIPSYQADLKKLTDDLVKKIPLQNKRALSHYIARRKLVLDLFQKMLEVESNKLKVGGRIDEDVLHNLIFQQSSTDPIKSDLWLINEDYIYFKGVSEGTLGLIEIDGTKILKDGLTEEEEEYRKKQGGDAKLKRTDILLFPAESKCIIIELKAPNVNISDHLNQINKYAALINNLSNDNFKFNTFYGYLIGESIDSDDVIDNDSDFINASSFGYIYRPYKRVAGKFGRLDGSLYTEIIKYSTLLERAKLRNKIFIDKLTTTKS